MRFQNHSSNLQCHCNGVASAFYVRATNRERRCGSERKRSMTRRTTRTTAEIERKPVIFYRAELWLLHDFVRHELLESRQWRHPPAPEALNEEIVLALDARKTHALPAPTIPPSTGH